MMYGSSEGETVSKEVSKMRMMKREVEELVKLLAKNKKTGWLSSNETLRKNTLLSQVGYDLAKFYLDSLEKEEANA